jgi:hypothetical protein
MAPPFIAFEFQKRKSTMGFRFFMPRLALGLLAVLGASQADQGDFNEHNIRIPR